MYQPNNGGYYDNFHNWHQKGDGFVTLKKGAAYYPLTTAAANQIPLAASSYHSVWLKMV